MTIFQFSNAQSIVRSCGTDIWVDQKINTDPTLQEYYDNSFRTFYQNNNTRGLSPEDCRIFIPVHIIIIHPPGQAIGEGDNLSLEHIQSQIDVINQDFGRYNPDAGNTPQEFSAEDTGIQFCLANMDPQGQPTDGVTRYATDAHFDFGIAGVDYDTRINIKRETGWDREQYLNIWVAPTIGTDSDIIGFSRVPGLFSHPDPDDDGLSILTDVFGGPGYGTLDPYNMGRTTTHEIGHYLGLLHVATKNNTCSGDDGIADTPQQFKQNHGCPTHPNISCGNNGDMFMNYMDYTDDVCMNAFTADQGDYMRRIIYSLRPGLIAHAPIACTDEIKIQIDIVNIEDASCYDGNDGFAAVDACGGNDEIYSYQIDGGLWTGTPEFNGLSSGEHVISVKNNLGVTSDTTITINSPEQLAIEIAESEDISCFGANDGSFSISITGGTMTDSAKYKVRINSGLITEILEYNTLPPGDYRIEVTDLNGCSATASLAIQSPNQLILYSTEIVDVDCYGSSSGKVSVIGSGGIPGYNYSFDGIIYNTESVFENLESGSVTLWVKDSNNCVTSSLFNVDQPALLEVSVAETQSVTCAGQRDASIQINGNGGVTPYSYILGNLKQTSGKFSGLGAGDYNLGIEDGNGCVVSTTITINDPPPISIDSIHVTDVLCAGDTTGAIEVIASGGTYPYSYFIDGVPDDDGIFENLSENLYRISVQDANQCFIASETVLITNGNLKVLQSEKSVPSCSYSLDGSLEVSANGGAGNYTYSIDGINFQEENTFNGLGSGIYIVRASDGEECLASTVIDLRAPAPLELESLDIVPPSCFGISDGIIDFEIRGGSGSYDYLLNGQFLANDFVADLKSGDYILEVTDAKGCRFETLIPLQGDEEINISLNSIIPADCSMNQLGSLHVTASGGVGDFNYAIANENNLSGLFEDLPGGDYDLTVTDSNGCSNTMDVQIPTIGGLQIALTSLQHEQCYGSGDGMFDLSVNGGASPYTYSFKDSLYDDGLFQDLDPGVYDIFISDQASCSENFQVIINPASQIILETVGGTKPSCPKTSDGTLRMTGSGGSGALLYKLGERENMTGIFPGVSAGNYLVTVTDENLCQEEFDVFFEGPERLKADSLEIFSPTCNGEDDGSIYFKVKGGTGMKEVVYSGEVYPSEILLDNISAGNFRFGLRDQKGCNERIDIFVDDPSSIEILDTVIVAQNIENNGSLELTVRGGTRPYAFSIDGGLSQPEGYFDDLPEGTYDVTITDGKGCQLIASITIPYDDSFENPPGSISDVLLGFERIRNETILSFIAHGNQKIQLFIFDVGGKFIMQTEEFTIDGPNRMTIPARNFPPGIYIVRIDALRESEYHKFIKL